MKETASKKEMDGAKKHPPSKRIPKRYVCIAKIEGNDHLLPAQCIKHRCSNLVKYVAFLDKQFPGWRWFNVFSNRGRDKGQQLTSFTRYNRPTSPRLDR